VPNSRGSWVAPGHPRREFHPTSIDRAAGCGS
jgi:hypothetical protein